MTTNWRRSFHGNFFEIFGCPKRNNPYLLTFFENKSLVTFSITLRAVVWVVYTDFFLKKVEITREFTRDPPDHDL